MNFDLDPGDFVLMSESIPKRYLSDPTDVNNDTDDKFNLSTVQSLPENDSFQDMSWEYIGFGISGTRENTRIIHYLFGSLLVLIGCCGIIGNGLVLYVFTRFTRRLRGGGSTLILSLATGDFLVSVLHFMPAYASFHEHWTFGDKGCEIYAAMVGLSGMASLLTLSAIAADRYSVIIGSPLLWLSAKKTCAAIWFFCLILTAPPFFGWSRYVKEGLETSCSWDYKTRDWNNRSYYIFLLLWGFTVPVLIIVYSYIGIIHVIYKHSKKMSGVTRNGITHNKKRLTKSDIRTAHVILTIIICFLTSWTPYALVSLIGQFGDERGLSPLATALPAVFAKASVVYNPIVYGLSHPHFRSALRMLKARHFPNNSSTNRASGPYDRYHYSPGGHLNSMKKGSERKSFNEGQRHNNNNHNHNRHKNGNRKNHHHRRHRHWPQRNGRDGAGLFRQPSNSQQQHSDGGENSRTLEISRSSGCGGGTDIMVNRRGWTVVRRLSPQIDSDTFQSSVVGIGNGEPISDACDAASHSEPDLVQRDESGKVILPECINMCEYGSGREKKMFLRKAFFRSESCLDNVLVKGKREKGMVETDLTTRRKSRKSPHSIVKKSMIVFSTAGITTSLSSTSFTRTVQTPSSRSSKLDLNLDEEQGGLGKEEEEDYDGSDNIYVANDGQRPVSAAECPSPNGSDNCNSDASDASSCCNDAHRNSGSTSSISNILYSSTNTNTNTNTNTRTNGHTNNNNNKRNRNEKVLPSFIDMDMNIKVQTKTDGLKKVQASHPNPTPIIDDTNVHKSSNNFSGNGKSLRRAFWHKKPLPSSSSLLFTSPASFKSKIKMGRNSKASKSKSKCSSPQRQRQRLKKGKMGENNEKQELEKNPNVHEYETLEHNFDRQLSPPSTPDSPDSLQQQQQRGQQQQQQGQFVHYNELDIKTQSTAPELQKSCNELPSAKEKITSIEFPTNFNFCPEPTNEFQDAVKDQELTPWRMTLTNEYACQQRPSFKVHRHMARELSRISSESEEENYNDDDDNEMYTRQIPSKNLNLDLDKVQNRSRGQRQEDDDDRGDIEQEQEQDEIPSVNITPNTPTLEYECERAELVVAKVLHRGMDR